MYGTLIKARVCGSWSFQARNFSKRSGGKIRLPHAVHYERTGCGSIHIYGTYLICGEHRVRYLVNPVLPGRRPEAEFLPGSILVWNLENGELVGALPGHPGGINSLTTIPIPKGNPLLVSSGGGEIRLWELDLPR